MLQSLRTQAYSWKGLWSLGVYKHPRRPGVPVARFPSWEPAILSRSAVQCQGPLANAFLSVSCLLRGDRVARIGVCDPGPFSAYCSVAPCPPRSLMWRQPLGKTLALASRGSWEPILGGLHFLKLDSCIFPSKSILKKKKITLENNLQNAISQT